MELKIVNYDDSKWTTDAEKVTYLKNKKNYANILFKKDYETWSAAFVTGHKYKVHWGHTGIDFEKLQARVSERWEETDKVIHMVHNHTDVRASITVTDSSIGVLMKTIPSLEPICPNLLSLLLVRTSITLVKQGSKKFTTPSQVRT